MPAIINGSILSHYNKHIQNKNLSILILELKKKTIIWTVKCKISPKWPLVFQKRRIKIDAFQKLNFRKSLILIKAGFLLRDAIQNWLPSFTGCNNRHDWQACQRRHSSSWLSTVPSGSRFQWVVVFWGAVTDSLEGTRNVISLCLQFQQGFYVWILCLI